MYILQTAIFYSKLDGGNGAQKHQITDSKLQV